MELRIRKYATLTPGAREWVWQQGPIDLDTLSDFIGGSLELVPVEVDCTLYCHEEGKILNLPQSAIWMYNDRPHDVLMGPLMLFGPCDEEGYETNLTFEIMEAVNEVIIPVGTLEGLWTQRSN